MARYAEGTTVPIEKTQTELQSLLRKHGAEAIVMGWEGDRHVVGFRMKGRQVQYTVKKPTQTDRAVQYTASGKWRNSWSQEAAIEAEERRRWRALLLIVKAKLELIASGDADFDDEFLPRVMLPGGQTFREWAGPQLDQLYETGKLPPLLPGAQIALPPKGGTS